MSILTCPIDQLETLWSRPCGPALRRGRPLQGANAHPLAPPLWGQDRCAAGAGAVEDPRRASCLYSKNTNKKRLGSCNLRTAFYFYFPFSFFARLPSWHCC